MKKPKLAMIFIIIMLISISGCTQKEVKKTCSDGTSIGKCSKNASFYCNVNSSLVEQCTICHCRKGVCNGTTKMCEIERCPPYETSCDLDKEMFSTCSSLSDLKLKGNKTIGVVILSQFSEEQFPKSYVHLLKDELSLEERTFFEKIDSIQNKIDYYKLDYMNVWLDNQSNRILNNPNYADLNFVFPAKEICYLNYDDYHVGGNETKLFSFIENNCMQGLNTEDMDVLLVLAFGLENAETLRGGAGLSALKGGVATIFSSGPEEGFVFEKNKTRNVRIAWADVIIMPQFCKTKVVPKYEKCQFPRGKIRTTDCVELNCSREECCFNTSLQGCQGGCKPNEIGISLIIRLSAHEIMHHFGAGDHHWTDETSVSGYSDCDVFDLSTLPYNITSCEHTSCLMGDAWDMKQLECNLLCGKEVREIGWNDNNGNGILEVEE